MSKSVPKPEDPPTWQMQESSFPRKATVYPFCPGWIQYWSGSCHLYWFHARICTAPQWWSPPGWSGRAQGIEYTLKFLLRHFCNWRMLATWWSPPGWRGWKVGAPRSSADLAPGHERRAPVPKHHLPVLGLSLRHHWMQTSLLFSVSLFFL